VRLKLGERDAVALKGAEGPLIDDAAISGLFEEAGGDPWLRGVG
jgi:hypothetical protein